MSENEMRVFSEILKQKEFFNLGQTISNIKNSKIVSNIADKAKNSKNYFSGKINSAKNYINSIGTPVGPTYQQAIIDAPMRVASNIIKEPAQTAGLFLPGGTSMHLSGITPGIDKAISPVTNRLSSGINRANTSIQNVLNRY